MNATPDILERTHDALAGVQAALAAARDGGAGIVEQARNQAEVDAAIGTVLAVQRPARLRAAPRVDLAFGRVDVQFQDFPGAAGYDVRLHTAAGVSAVRVLRSPALLPPPPGPLEAVEIVALDTLGQAMGRCVVPAPSAAPAPDRPAGDAREDQ